MNKVDQTIAKLLKIDPLAEAEKITGVSYKGSDVTSFLGMGIMHAKNKDVDSLLAMTNDSTFSMKVTDYLDVVKEEGFEIVLELSSVVTLDYQGKSLPESEYEHVKLFVLWHDRDGLLLAFDTCGESVNGGHVYYNIMLHEDERARGVTESGGYSKHGCFVGSHDCRTAIRFHMRQLRSGGVFLREWKERPSLWLLHWGDTRDKSFNSKAINAERIAMLPEHVRKAITPEPLND